MDEAGIVRGLKRLSIQTPTKMSNPSLLLSDDEVLDIIAKTSTPTVIMPLPLVSHKTFSTTSLVSTLSTQATVRVSPSEKTTTTEVETQITPATSDVSTNESVLGSENGDSGSLFSPSNSASLSESTSTPGSQNDSSLVSPTRTSTSTATTLSDAPLVDHSTPNAKTNTSSSVVASPVLHNFLTPSLPRNSDKTSPSSPIVVSAASDADVTGELDVSSIPPPHTHLSKSLPNFLEHSNVDSSVDIEKEFDILKKIVYTATSKHDLMFNKMESDIHAITDSVQNWVTTFVDSTKQRIEEFVNEKLCEFIECKQDVKIATDKCEDSLTKMIAACDAKSKQIDNLIKNNQRLTEELNQRENIVPNSRADMDTLRRFEHLEKELHKLDVRLLECEQYSRRESVIISGIPNHVQQGELEDVTLGIFKELGINIHHSDISAIHRLGGNTTRYPTRVIVRFVNRKFADLCMNRKDQLPDLKRSLRMNLRFYESLASLNQEALRIANHLVDQGEIRKCFLRNGFVKIVTNENETVRVNHPEFLRENYTVPDEVNNRGH